jgi:hypothetical protein
MIYLFNWSLVILSIGAFGPKHDNTVGSTEVDGQAALGDQRLPFPDNLNVDDTLLIEAVDQTVDEFEQLLQEDLGLSIDSNDGILPFQQNSDISERGGTAQPLKISNLKNDDPKQDVKFPSKASNFFVNDESTTGNFIIVNF